MSRVIVIGAGVAGLTAALRLARAGLSVTLLNKGVGGLQLSQGTVDVLGYATRPDDVRATTRVTNPLAAVAELAEANPKHPYAAVGADAVRAGVEFLRAELGEKLLVGDIEANYLFPTAVGAIRPTCLAQPSMLAGACVAGAQFAIVGLRRLKDFHAELVAGNLARTTLPDGGRLAARSLVIDVPARAREIDSSGLTYARAFDDPEFRARFAAELRPELKPGETVGLPAVLGLKDLTAWQHLAELLDHPVFEIPLPPPSVPGMRLNNALMAAVRAAGVRVVNGSFVDTPVVKDGRLVSVSSEAAGASRAFTGDAFVLATGGFESGALTLDSYGEVTERIFGLPLTGPAAGPLLHGDYWGAEQPLFEVGVAVDETMRVIPPGTGDGSPSRPASETGDGSASRSAEEADASETENRPLSRPAGRGTVPCPTNLWAAGGILAGAVRWREKSGEGIAVGSAVKAADAIVEELA
ncbi:MAG: glycerol-3-phosphate dehydrogenase subunit GlpB [Propionibacteriaceae bacterium]|nr:glycerol-3-phosphate dehydrogenase subunit GlpB [Propionibacteriaceae bacterium]